jgi:hypothetical protein
MVGAIQARPLAAFSRPQSSFAQTRATLTHVPLPVALLLISVLLPGELDFYLGTIRLSCQRLVLIAFLPSAFMRMIAGKDASLRSFDVLFFCTFAYYVFATFVKEPADKAVVTGGILFLEGMGGYLIARAYIRDKVQFLSTVKLLFIIVLILAAMAIPESMFFQHFVKNLAARISGAPQWPPGESRLGLLRAMAVFDHPIHYGTFCASVFGLVWFTGAKLSNRLFRGGLVAAAAFFSLSAGPIQGIVFILMAALWERTTRQVPHRVWLTVILMSILYGFAALLTNRPPIKILITTFVLDSNSAWYRMLIWDYGFENVLDNPWFGVPLGTWVRPAWMPNDTIDNYWLVTAMWGGLPTVSLQILSILALLRSANRRPTTSEDPERRASRYAWSATVLTMCLIGGTVHYWGALSIHFMFCLGMGGWLADRRFGRAPSSRGRSVGPRVLPVESDSAFVTLAPAETIRAPR